MDGHPAGKKYVQGPGERQAFFQKFEELAKPDGQGRIDMEKLLFGHRFNSVPDPVQANRAARQGDDPLILEDEFGRKQLGWMSGKVSVARRHEPGCFEGAGRLNDHGRHPEHVGFALVSRSCRRVFSRDQSATFYQGSFGVA
ncbi:MAG: hypothetical protein V4731_02830 [Pseudomonadota bacterium]